MKADHLSAFARPFVLVNMAMTADGKIATANREVASFGSARDKEHLLELRSTADAVMAGARTVDSNPVNLGPGPARFRKARLERGLAEYNLRIVVSGSGSLDPRSRIFQFSFSPVIVLTTGRIPQARLRSLKRVADAVRICGEDEINWQETLEWLRYEWDVKRLLCEGGGELNDAIIRRGFIDELHLTVCPLVFGGRAAPTIADGVGAGRLDDAAKMELKSMRKVGKELFLVYTSLRTDR
jgi:5-amino-6-(5-phosphoribosylamino)uracil reductase